MMFKINTIEMMLKSWPYILASTLQFCAVGAYNYYVIDIAIATNVMCTPA